MLASQPVSGLNSHFEDGSLTLTAPVSPETKLVATIPTTTAAYAAPAAHSGDFQPDSMTADLENAKSAMQAYLQQEAAHCAKQSCTSDLGGCLDCNTVPAAPLVDIAQAVTMKAAVSASLQDDLHNDPAVEQPIALQSLQEQPCREVLQTLDMFDEVEQRRHKQASRAAKRVHAVHQQQLLWAAKSEGHKESCDTSAWACA